MNYNDAVEKAEDINPEIALSITQFI